MTRGARNKIDSENLLARVDILKVIQAIVHLKGLKSFGKNEEFISICPFHFENNPSFVIYMRSQRYYCHGCGQIGNALSFLSRYCDSSAPIIDLAKLAVKKKWCTWRQIRPTSPSSMVPESLWRIRDYLVLDFYVAPGCPKDEGRLLSGEDYIWLHEIE